jgi:GNAT superfamily N-acetyltransferase
VSSTGGPDVSSDQRQVRTATADDVNDIVALVESAYRGEDSQAGWTTEAELVGGQRTDAPAVAAAVAAPYTVILLGEDNGDLVSCAQLTRQADRVEFGMFCVRPGAQGGGLGRWMLARAEQVAADCSAATMEMLVIRQRDELIAWYERRGYQRTGETRPFPYGNERYGLPRRDDLEFVVLTKTLNQPEPP